MNYYDDFENDEKNTQRDIVEKSTYEQTINTLLYNSFFDSVTIKVGTMPRIRVNPRMK